MGGSSKSATATTTARRRPVPVPDDKPPKGIDPAAWARWSPWVRDLARKAAKLKGAF